MAEIVRRKSWGGVLPLGRHASIRGSSFIQCASVSIALSSVQEGQTARHHKQFKLEQALVCYRFPARCCTRTTDFAPAVVLWSQALPKLTPLMHGPMFLILIICLGLAGVTLARLLLLPFAKAVQARQGYSDQFVTDLALAVPLGAFAFAALAGLIWLAR